MFRAQLYQATEVMISTMITQKPDKNITERVSKGNNSLDDNEICLLCCNICDLIERIEKNHLKFVDGERRCQDHKIKQTKKYSEILDKGGIFTTREHYADLDDSVKLSNISEKALCDCPYKHNNQKLRERYRKKLQDLEAAINDKTYSVNLKNDYERVEYLRSQGYEVQEGHDADTLYIITMPSGRAATISQEAEAIAGLTRRPVITNMDKRFFVVLRNVNGLKRE